MSFVSLKIFCMTLKHYSVLQKLPKSIIPFGLGDHTYPKGWLSEKNGDNILSLNKFYGETTGMYWIWKNYLDKFKKDDWIGFCQYRRFWLNDLYIKKQNFTFKSLYSNLLSTDTFLKQEIETYLVQQTFFTNHDLLDQFETLYGKNIINECAKLVFDKDKEDFRNFLNGNRFSICNMFITKPRIFEQYCEEMFNWIEKCYEYCNKKKLLKGKNMRLPVFMVERFTSFWFEKYTKVDYLSFARLGDFFLSDNINKIINPLKLPFSFKMYPTLHRY